MTELEELSTADLAARTEREALADPSREAEARWTHVNALRARADRDVLDAALAWCGADEPLLRCLGADVLGQLGVDQPYADESSAPLCELTADDDPRVVACALVALGHLGVGEVSTIVRHAGHADEDVRHAVSFALGTREGETALGTLLRLMGDPVSEVRSWATFGIGSLSDADGPELRLALVERLDDEDHEVRGEAMVGLARRGDARAVPAILEELEGDAVSALAIEAVTELPDPAFLPELEALHETHPDDPTIRLAVEMCRAI